MKTLEKTLTEKTIAEILSASTGEHFLDSGGVYGRHWQRNQENPPENKPEISYYSYRPDSNEYTEFWFTINIYYFLTSIFQVDEKLDKMLWVYDRLTGSKKNYLELAQDFGELLAEKTGKKDIVFNTYNEPDSWYLSQDFQCVTVLDDYYDSNQVWIVNVHQGADIRGGYTKPVVLKPVDVERLEPYVTIHFSDELYLDWQGEWIDFDGQSVDLDDYLKQCEYKENKLYFDGKEISVNVAFL